VDIRGFVEIVGDAAEIAGVLLVAGGLVIASARYALARHPDGMDRYTRYRHDLGRAILLGLEVLVAADIIQTVTLSPTMDSVIALGIIVVIRTFLSWSLALELEGRWPWQRAAEQIEPGRSPHVMESSPTSH
jgi:uncharacterized membrane protein